MTKEERQEYHKYLKHQIKLGDIRLLVNGVVRTPEEELQLSSIRGKIVSEYGSVICNADITQLSKERLLKLEKMMADVAGFLKDCPAIKRPSIFNWPTGLPWN